MNSKGKKQIRAFNVYLDKNGNSIYYDRFSKCGYLLKEEVFPRFRTYNNRYMLAFMFGVLAYNFIANLLGTIIITIAIGLAMEYFFRKKFLAHLTKYPNFKPEIKASGKNSDESNFKVVVRLLLYLAFAILIVVNAYQQNYGTLSIVFSYIAAVIALYGVFDCIKALLRK